MFFFKDFLSCPNSQTGPALYDVDICEKQKQTIRELHSMVLNQKKTVKPHMLKNTAPKEASSLRSSLTTFSFPAREPLSIGFRKNVCTYTNNQRRRRFYTSRSTPRSNRNPSDSRIFSDNYGFSIASMIKIQSRMLFLRQLGAPSAAVGSCCQCGARCDRPGHPCQTPALLSDGALSHKVRNRWSDPRAFAIF